MRIFRRIFGRRKADDPRPSDRLEAQGAPHEGADRPGAADAAEAATDGETPLSETTQYILDAIRKQVWSGFYRPEDVQQTIDDILQDDADEPLLRAAVAPEFEKKAAAEASWPETTDCDRLDQAFEEMNARGIIALRNAGYTQSDGYDDATEALHERGSEGVQGYCFYHGQDVEDALAGRGLYLAFGVFGGDETATGELGHLVRSIVESRGLRVEWDGSPETRLHVAEIDWKRRLSA